MLTPSPPIRFWLVLASSTLAACGAATTTGSAPMTALAVDAQPTIGQAGATLAAITVSGRDALGNVAPLSATTSLSIALLTAPAGAALDGTTTALANASGAMFTDLSVTPPGV